ncbi:hypothetical protein PoB_007352700 [Plakobranchus ocellatus]|uniref:Uncharacterized protein n=1 Tax=Plakobranchus ocellatus TaxID=259542 RepID=A0AAV4DRU3_9GAST|nr:hypothetical protein PoB_007352700 [Plakobranchus ocellatus]
MWLFTPKVLLLVFAPKHSQPELSRFQDERANPKPLVGFPAHNNYCEAGGYTASPSVSQDSNPIIESIPTVESASRISTITKRLEVLQVP